MSQQAVERALRVDDLSFTDLLRIALEEIPGASGGRWTLHGPVDPGITLLERSAWELEQRLFSAEQVTDEMVRASLRLLGLGEPGATTCARTVLCLHAGAGSETGSGAGSATAAGRTDVPAGSVFALRRDPGGRRCALTEPVTVLPVGPFEAAGRLFGVGDRLELTHRHQGQPLASATLSLLLDLAAAPGVPPSWSPEAVEVPPPATLRWTAVGPDGSESPVAVTDTTGGLRRSGLLRLEWPVVWDTPGSDHCRLRVEVVGGGYPDPVRVLGVHPNAVPAEHRVSQTRDVTDQLAALPPLPGGRVRLPGTANRLLDGAGGVTLDVTEPSQEPVRWTAVASWTGTGPRDRVFVVDRERGELQLGDGRAGRILRVGEETAAVARFATGGGDAGNLGKGGDWIREDGPGVATNPVPVEGGHEAEDVAAAALRAAADLDVADRTVTLEDVRRLTLTTPGVGLERAHPSLGLHPDFPCVPIPSAVSVTVVPHADRSGDPAAWIADPVPDDGMLAAVRARLGRGRLVGQEVFVLPPVYREVRVAATVTRSALSPVLEGRLERAIRRFLDALEGGSEGQGWDFGGPVRPSALMGVLARELGPESTVTGVEVTLDDEATNACDDVSIGERELVRFAGLVVTWVDADPVGGGLR